MKKRTLGHSSLQVSELSLGCMSLPVDLTEARPIIEKALDSGINYFDTADLYAYGENERIVGEVLKEKRHQVIIATKVGNRFREGAEGWTWDASPTYLEQAVKASLARLQTDYIDSVQLHGGTREDDLQAVIETFEKLQKDGLIRHYGLSSIRPNVFMPFSEASTAISNMMQYNLLDRRAEEWFTSLAANGLSVVTRGSLAKGLLTNEWRKRAEAYMSYEAKELNTLLAKIEDAYPSVHSVALAYNLQHPVVASTVIGASSAQQLQQTIDAYEQIEQLPSLEPLEHLLKEDVYTEHR